MFQGCLNDIAHFCDEAGLRHLNLRRRHALRYVLGRVADDFPSGAVGLAQFMRVARAAGPFRANTSSPLSSLISARYDLAGLPIVIKGSYSGLLPDIKYDGRVAYSESQDSG